MQLQQEDKGYDGKYNNEPASDRPGMPSRVLSAEQTGHKQQTRTQD